MIYADPNPPYDYWKVHDALANREICCDRGSREKKPAPEKEPPGAKSGGD